ncbi:KH domain-containing protein [Calothrix sp. 336/3]|uniref:KH domain-containing protein n=1 Tax=Calothrix sp. 336/3 TaxID=1337936 RepID=UPI0004E2AC1B|nr:KH domain-containing protein [Calothrix sp. 336/3]AKG23154.1 RNA-binding protein [Calothrix sp. 336/3]
MQKQHPNVGAKSSTAYPDYVGLVRFLMQPFLESPDSLSVDCEISHTRNRVWIRIAFDSTDKGKVFGRGGRNIQAIRTVIAAAAEAAGQSVYLDIYGSNAIGRDGSSFDEETEERLPMPKPRDRRGNDSRPVVKSRSR